MLPDNWELWLDTQLSPIIAKWMAEYTGFSVKSCYSLQSNTLTDLQIYQRAQSAGNIILISKDADFPELVARLGSPPKLIVIKKGNCDNKAMWAFIKPHIIKALNALIETDINIVELA